MLRDENHLVNLFIEHARYKKNESVIIKEFNTEFGRPDLIQVILNKEILKKRCEVNNSIVFNKNMEFAMAFLHGKSWVKIETLNKALDLDSKEGEKLIRILEENKFINLEKTYVKSLPTKELLVIKRLIAYEAKLDKWKDVIEQAQRHLWFTNESNIIIPSKSDELYNKIFSKCKECGLGIYVMGENEKFTNHNTLSNKRLINTPLLWKINEAIIRGELDARGNRDFIRT